MTANKDTGEVTTKDSEGEPEIEAELTRIAAVIANSPTISEAVQLEDLAAGAAGEQKDPKITETSNDE